MMTGEDIVMEIHFFANKTGNISIGMPLHMLITPFLPVLPKKHICILYSINNKANTMANNGIKKVINMTWGYFVHYMY